ncbi:hypothetical protein [Roseisalinus antarcticus]|uniref:Uncharacterized protein n=1 Tax=Roseisalinus antarcticus TaxID=254357 RepID=A0A1Y5THN0_9RHOB|nr:hypothetical protein [Roseisalinus antarcticus]SLN64326.1 hypothetical protein ROA7023_03006 [Roseisalinus antarcticus]
MRLTKAELAGRVEPFLLARMPDRPDGFALREYRPQVTAGRLDLGVKLAYLRSLDGPPGTFHEALYDAHIAAFSLGDMAEPGDVTKADLGTFKTRFAALAASIEAGGFDPDTTLVPLASDGTILNGAHRTAAAIHHGRPLVGVETGLDPVRYDHRFFRSRGMPEEAIDAAALAHVAAAPHAAVALLWPAAPNAEDKVEAILGPVAHRKAVRLSPRGGHNLMSQVYAGEAWLGPPEQDHPGIAAKMVPCFSGSQPLRVLVFDVAPGRDRIAAKEEVRALFGLGKHSIHITDTHAEAVDLARLLLNPSSVHMLNHAMPNRFVQVRRMAEDFRQLLDRSDMSPEEVAIDSGMVLGLYGIRAPSDLDYIAARPGPDAGEIEWHDGRRHGPAVADMLADPRNHLHYWGLRFVSLARVAEMKEQRRAGRDAEDLVQIAPLLRESSRGAAWRSLVYRLRFAQSRVRRTVIRGLGAVGLKEHVKTLRASLRGNR